MPRAKSPADDSPFSPEDFVFQQNRRAGKGWDAVLEDLKPLRGVSTSNEQEALRCVLDGMAMLRAIAHHRKIPVSIRMDAAAKLAEYGLSLARKSPAGGKAPKGVLSDLESDDLAELARSLSGDAVTAGGSAGLPLTEEPVDELPPGWGEEPQEGEGQGDGVAISAAPDPAPPPSTSNPGSRWGLGSAY